MSLRDVSLQRLSLHFPRRSKLSILGFRPIGGRREVFHRHIARSKGLAKGPHAFKPHADLSQLMESPYTPYTSLYDMLRLQHVATEGARRERSCIWRPKRSIRAGDQMSLVVPFEVE